MMLSVVVHVLLVVFLSVMSFLRRKKDLRLIYFHCHYPLFFLELEDQDLDVR